MWIINRATDCKQRYQLLKWKLVGERGVLGWPFHRCMKRAGGRGGRLQGRGESLWSQMANTEQHDHLGNFCFCSGVGFFHSLALDVLRLRMFVHLVDSLLAVDFLHVCVCVRWKTEIMWRQKQQHHHRHHQININRLPLCEKDEKHMRKREKCAQLH